jgi:hypothetical protein
VDPEDPARQADVAELFCEAEQSQPEPVQHVIIDHDAAPPAHRFEHDKHGEAASLVIGPRTSRVSGELGDCSP